VIVNEFQTAGADLRAPRARDRRPAGEAPDEPERGLLNTPAVQAPGYKHEKSGRHGKRLGAELRETVTMLAKDESLARRYFDHPRELSDYRDCHIKRDLLLIYRKPDEASRELVRLGSHGELGL